MPAVKQNSITIHPDSGGMTELDLLKAQDAIALLSQDAEVDRLAKLHSDKPIDQAIGIIMQETKGRANPSHVFRRVNYFR